MNSVIKTDKNTTHQFSDLESIPIDIEGELVKSTPKNNVENLIFLVREKPNLVKKFIMKNRLSIFRHLLVGSHYHGDDELNNDCRVFFMVEIDKNKIKKFKRQLKNKVDKIEFLKNKPPEIEAIDF